MPYEPRNPNPAPPLPAWSNFFDYWDADPDMDKEFHMVAPGRDIKRKVTGGIQRERGSATTRGLLGPYQSVADSAFEKMPGQGAFDNLHLAPRMKFTSALPGDFANAMTGWLAAAVLFFNERPRRVAAYECDVDRIARGGAVQS